MEMDNRYYIPRLVISFLGTAASTLFIAVGVISLSYGALFGLEYLVIGLGAAWVCILFGMLGGRLGVTIDENAVVIHGYYSKKIIPLSKIRFIARSDESTTLDTLDGSVDINHSFLINQDENHVFNKLQEYLDQNRHLHEG